MPKFFNQLVRFTAIILQFAEQGEKTGWTYITVPASVASQLNPGNKKSFRVKGRLDDYSIQGIALIPMGEGNFIMALNAELRKKIKKRKGAIIRVELQKDNNPVKMDAELMECLADEPQALAFFNNLSGSHRNYFSRWVGSAKMESTKAKRIARVLTAFTKGQSFSEMIRSFTKSKDL